MRLKSIIKQTFRSLKRLVTLRTKVQYQLVSFIIVEQERLFERTSDIRVCGGTLEVGGSKLGKLVL